MGRRSVTFSRSNPLTPHTFLILRMSKNQKTSFLWKNTRFLKQNFASCAGKTHFLKTTKTPTLLATGCCLGNPLHSFFKSFIWIQSGVFKLSFVSGGCDGKSSRKVFQAAVFRQWRLYVMTMSRAPTGWCLLGPRCTSKHFRRSNHLMCLLAVRVCDEQGTAGAREAAAECH